MRTGDSFKNLVLDESNKDQIFAFLNEMVGYIHSLSLSKVKITSSLRKTGFIGFLINIESLKGIYHDYVETHFLNRIPTLRMSQDFLESFFGRCRTTHGSNNHPTEEQFRSVFRKMLVNSELTSSPFANCIDKLSILSISSRKNQSTPQSSNEDDVNFVCLHQLSTHDYLLDIFQHSSITYIAGTIEGNLLNTGHFNCKRCDEVFRKNEVVQANFIGSKKIKIPCKSTVDICIVASKFTKIYENNSNNH